MIDFGDIGKSAILSLRKQNRPIADLVSAYLEYEPLVAEYISTIHVLRICHENNLSFNPKEIRAYCKKVYTADMGGDILRPHYLVTLRVFTADCLKYSGKHKISFKNTSSPKKSHQIYTLTQGTNTPQSTKVFQSVIDTPQIKIKENHTEDNSKQTKLGVFQWVAVLSVGNLGLSISKRGMESPAVRNALIHYKNENGLRKK